MKKLVLILVILSTLGAPDAIAGRRGAPGVLTLSTGQEYKGGVAFTNPKKLKVYDLHRKKYISIAAGEIASITTKVTKKEMRKNWVFKEEGSPEKIETGGQYPRMDFEHSMVLTSGATVRCHIVTTVYVYIGDKRLKFQLRKKERGAAGAKLTDILFIRSIVFTTDVSAGGRTITGKITEGITLKSALAVNRADAVSYEADITEKGKAFGVKALPEGCYDLLLVAEKALYLWVAVDEADNLSVADNAELVDFIQSVKDFFDDKSPLVVRGSRKRARVLVEMKRFRKTSFDKKATMKIYFRRLELWTMHRTDKRWKIDKRTFLFREQVPVAGKGTHVIFDPDLGGKEVKGDTRELKIEFTPKE